MPKFLEGWNYKCQKGKNIFSFKSGYFFQTKIFLVCVCAPIFNGFYAFHPKLYYKSLIIG